jgi:hypothetical protein
MMHGPKAVAGNILGLAIDDRRRRTAEMQRP